MKDIHSHLLPGIDDGCTDFDESIALLKELEKKGVTEIVLTPHYIKNSKFTCNKDEKKKIYNKLIKKVKENNIDIKLYLGNEIYLDDDILDLLEKKEIETINNSKYLLIEFPMFTYQATALNIFDELIHKGYKIILAHPERYPYVVDDIHLLDKYKDMGVLFQGNYESLYDKYGKQSRKTLKKLLKMGYISFLASDTHHTINLDIKKLKRKLRWYISKNEINYLLEGNFEKVINNIDVGDKNV